MFELDGSHTSWLVYADFLEDQDILANHLRETPFIVNGWHFEIDTINVKGFANSVFVENRGVGWCGESGVGCRIVKVGSATFIICNNVGGG